MSNFRPIAHIQVPEPEQAAYYSRAHSRGEVAVRGRGTWRVPARRAAEQRRREAR